MKAKTQLEFFRALRRQQKLTKSLAKGFTLVELMIVVAVIGILSAVALPQYLKARARAAAGASIGEAIGLAKECAVGQASKMVSGDSSCDGSAAVTFVASWTGDADGVRCLDVTIGTGVTSATVTVTTTGVISCT